MASIVKLSDGREVKLDLLKCSLRQFRWISTNKNQVDEDRWFADFFELELEEYQTLPYPDWRLLLWEFFQAANNPLASPNSPSESTSTSSTGQPAPGNTSAGS